MKDSKVKLSLNKEKLKNLKVKTDVKAGLALSALACCTKTHHCSISLVDPRILVMKTY